MLKLFFILSFAVAKEERGGNAAVHKRGDRNRHRIAKIEHLGRCRNELTVNKLKPNRSQATDADDLRRRLQGGIAEYLDRGGKHSKGKHQCRENNAHSYKAEGHGSRIIPREKRQKMLAE